MNQYDEIKSLLKKTRMLMEQAEATNLAKSIESEIETDVRQDDEVDVEKVKKDKSKTYRISGGLLTIHGKDKKDLELTTDEKTAFQETMDEFVDEVSDLSDFGVLNMYPNDVQWSGKVIDFDLEFFYSIGENNGVYINGDMIKLDEKLTELVNKLTSFYEKFKSKWAKVISTRKKTSTKKEEE
jgi:Asp-tRNA(Asn)/Glu-tRNA(Gln) amidotransferase C subunit